MRKLVYAMCKQKKAQISLFIHAVWSVLLCFAAHGSIIPVHAKSKLP